MGFYYWLEQAKQKEKIYLAKQNEFLDRERSFPKENELTKEQYELKQDYLRLRSELATLWYQVAKRCPTQGEANQYYEKSAKLGYLPAQQKINFRADIVIKEEADLLRYPIGRLTTAGCYGCAVHLREEARSKAGEAEQAERVGDNNMARTKLEESRTCAQLALHYCNYSAIQQYPPALTDMAWILIHDDFARNTENPRTPAEFDKANSYLAKAMEHDHAEAFYKKGLQYQNGWAEKENKELAMKYFREAAKRGSREAIDAMDEEYKRYYPDTTEKRSVYLDNPELLARIILDCQLGARQATRFLQTLTTELPFNLIRDPIVQELFSLIPNASPPSSLGVLKLLEMAVTAGCPLALEVLLFQIPGNLLYIAIKAYSREQSVLKKQGIKDCILLLLNKGASLTLNLLIEQRIDDVDILTWKLQHSIANGELYSLPGSDFSTAFTLKLLTLPLSKFSRDSLLFDLAERLHEENPRLLQAILRLVENPQTEDEKSAVYEAQGGHNALGFVLRVLYIIAVRRSDIPTCEVLRKGKFSFMDVGYFMEDSAGRFNDSVIYSRVQQEVVTQRNLDVLSLLIQSPFTPLLYSLEYLIKIIPVLIYPLITPTAENLQFLENSLGTKEDNNITLRRGFLSELINYLIAHAYCNERAFEFTLALINTDSEIIFAAINPHVFILVKQLMRSYPHLTAENLQKVSQLLQRKFFDDNRYQDLFNVIKQEHASKYHMLALLFVAVRQGIQLNYDQKRKANMVGFYWRSVDRHFQNASVASIIKELLTSVEDSAFWQLVKFEQEHGHASEKYPNYACYGNRVILDDPFHDQDPATTLARLHAHRRSYDENYIKFISALNDLRNPLVLEQLILHDNPRLGHGCDYLFLLGENKKSPEKALILLYICQQKQIAIPKTLIKELLELRHQMVDFLHQLKCIDLQVTKALLLDITNHEKEDAVHNEQKTTLLSAVFRMARITFLGIGIAPNPKDKEDAIAKAYKLLLEEVEPALLANPLLKALPPPPEKKESWPKEKSGLSNAKAIANLSPVLRKQLFLEEREGEETFNSPKIPRLRPTKGESDEDALL